jgi:hypothetical protein
VKNVVVFMNVISLDGFKFDIFVDDNLWTSMQITIIEKGAKDYST